MIPEPSSLQIAWRAASAAQDGGIVALTAAALVVAAVWLCLPAIQPPSLRAITRYAWVAIVIAAAGALVVLA